MEEHVDSYYSRTMTDKAARPALAGHIEADVCIIGGGLAGIAVATGLIERGRKPVILEGRRIGFGASGRNGGFVLAGFAADFSEIVKKAGADNAKALFGLTREAQKLIRARIKKYNIDCNPVDGHLRASWFNDPEYMKTYAEKYAQLGVPAEFWPREKVRDVCRTEHYKDGVFLADYFHMHPLNYLQGLAREIERKGGKIYENTMALRLGEGGSGDITVFTEHGSVKAKEVVFCGSAYTNGIEPRLSRSCLPVSTYVMVTEPLPKEKLESAIRAPYCIRDTRWADDYYRLLPDNRILWGGRVGLGRKAPANLDSLMLGDMLKVYPQLAGAKVAAAWAGIMGYTVHKMPHVGRLRPRVWMCTNFGGNGLGPTTAGGEVIASAIAEKDERYKLFAPFGFAWTGGVLGPLVAQGVYMSWELGDTLRSLKSAK